MGKITHILLLEGLVALYGSANPLYESDLKDIIPIKGHRFRIAFFVGMSNSN